ncbi:MAG: SUF system NifU family Fe-S cluster assembly protein [Chloroflexi bacterium]|nr:SUF system NifU family Fe-S cluster assembly protein [Chloroflexota bacterium]
MLGSGLDELYREVILDHYKAPRNRRHLTDPACSVRGHNPLCGDQITLELALDDAGRIAEAAFSGNGCAISQASASMLTEAAAGKTLDEAEQLAEGVRGMVMGTGPVVGDPATDLEALEGVKNFAVRVKCATLSWNTLRQAIQMIREGKAAADAVIEKE